jgi:serine phosphatase RsbU (regulator of sigma subunit)
MSLLGTAWRPKSIGERFSVAIGGGAALVLLALTAASYLGGRELLLSQTGGEALRQVQDEVGNWDDLIDRVSMLPLAIATAESASPGSVTTPWIARLLETCQMKAVYGLYVYREARHWKDPDAYVWVDRKSWPRGGRVAYDFHNPDQDWYAGARKCGGYHVTKPYFDAGGSDIEMISVTVPVLDASGRFLGVAGVDLSLEEMRLVVGEMHLRDFGSSPFILREESTPEDAGTSHSTLESSFMISGRGNVIIGPENISRLEPRGTSTSTAPPSLADAGLPLTPEHLRQILDRPKGWFRADEIGDKVLYWAQSRTTGWKLLLVVPYRMIVSPAIRLAWISALIAGLGLILLLGVIFLVSRRVSGPLLRLGEAAEDFERGDYESGERILGGIEKRPDELGLLARSFAAMTGEIRLREKRLEEWNEGLERTVRERTSELQRANAAMNAELAEAASYVQAVLPAKTAKPVSTDWRFITSSRLGGDSFGYRWLDEERFAIYLLDVCGHGVGAALLSVTVVNVLANSSLPDTDFTDPAAVLSALNRAFPMERYNEMFFTAWYGVYNLREGTIRHACGGHPPAFLIAQDGSAQCLGAKGSVLGAFPEALYETAETVVGQGSLLYLFSDGTYEITRPDGSMVTHAEFCEILRGAAGDSLEEIVRTMASIQGSERFVDDFSLVKFRFGSQESASTGS